ncbi:MAG: methyltransferase domain-containing protein, partial [Anaerolineales bacterium]|nr:methyltransferase domain-containing protein [Anaerolineales bacterium]
MTTGSASALDTSFREYQAGRRGHWDLVARQLDTWKGWGSSYHRRLAQVYAFVVAPGQRVLEIGCGRGDLLASLQPALGVGIDFSAEMVRRAARRHPGLRFVQADAHALP